MAREAPVFPRALRRDIAALICVKVLLLGALYWTFFAPHEVTVAGGGAVRAHIIASGPSGKGE